MAPGLGTTTVTCMLVPNDGDCLHNAVTEETASAHMVETVVKRCRACRRGSIEKGVLRAVIAFWSADSTISDAYNKMAQYDDHGTDAALVDSDDIGQTGSSSGHALEEFDTGEPTAVYALIIQREQAQHFRRILTSPAMESLRGIVER